MDITANILSYKPTFTVQAGKFIIFSSFPEKKNDCLLWNKLNFNQTGFMNKTVPYSLQTFAFKVSGNVNLSPHQLIFRLTI